MIYLLERKSNSLLEKSLTLNKWRESSYIAKIVTSARRSANWSAEDIASCHRRWGTRLCAMCRIGAKIF
jgi:hypothetical protein